MTGIFRQKAPGNIVLLILLGIFMKLPAFFHAQSVVVKQSDAVFYIESITYLRNLLQNSALAFNVLAFVLNLFIALALTNFINTERFMPKPNFLPGMAYMLITSLLPSFNMLSAHLVASSLLFLAFKNIYQSHSTKNHIFNAGMFIGLASLFFLPALIFVLWAFLALVVLRPFKITDWILLLMGICSPYYFYIAYLFLTDQITIHNYFYHLSFLKTTFTYSAWLAGALFLLLVPVLVGIYYVQANASKMLFHVKKGWDLILGYLVVTIFIMLFNFEKSLENVIIMLAPLAAFQGYGYLKAELKPYSKTLFWVTVLFIIINQLYSDIW